MDYTVTFENSRELCREAAKQLYLQWVRPKKLVLLAGVTLVSIAILLLVYQVHPNPSRITWTIVWIMTGFFVANALFSICLFFMFRRWADRSYNSLSHYKVSLTADDERLTIISCRGERQKSWSELNRTVETKHFLFLFKGKSFLAVLPKQFCNPEIIELVKEKANKPGAGTKNTPQP